MEIPSELMTPEQRAARIGEARSEIRAAWLRFALLELVVGVLPVAVLLVLWANDSIAGWVAVVGSGVAACLVALLATETAVLRVRPLEREIKELESARVENQLDA